jgi:hypothetical protein
MVKAATEAHRTYARKQLLALRHAEEHDFHEVIDRATATLPQYSSSPFFNSILHRLWRTHPDGGDMLWWQALEAKYRDYLKNNPWLAADHASIPAISDEGIAAIADLLVAMRCQDKQRGSR